MKSLFRRRPNYFHDSDSESNMPFINPQSFFGIREYLSLTTRYIKRRQFVCYLLLLVIAIPPLELLRRYHEDLWEWCPGETGIFKYDSEVVFSKCEIPAMQLWDPTIAQYLHAEKPIEPCFTDYPLVKFTWSLSSSRLILTEKGRRDMPYLSCVYKTAKRNTDDKTLEYSDEHEARFPLEMPAEIVQVVCRKKSDNSVVYTDSFGTIIPKKQKPLKDKNQKWNVLFLGIDSVSRQSFIRFLPKSYEWLKQKEGVHIFDAFHKIGENTFPNIVPMLTGRKVELSSDDEPFQLPHSGSFYTWVLRLAYDNFPLIWKEFKEEGYATGFVEDDPGIGMFNLMKRGFIEQPTDVYGRPLFLSFEDFRHIENEINPNLTAVNETTGDWYVKEPPYFCVNGRQKFEIHWDYSIKQFLTKYSAQGTPTFMLSWLVGLTHEWLTTLKLADEPLLELLKYISDESHKEDNESWRDHTFVFLLSDHGQRVDRIRSTFVGRLEDRLPFLAVSIPKKFREKYPKMSANLETNTHRLVTTLDIYGTLRHLLYLSKTGDTTDDGAGFTDVGPSGYSVSLFNVIDENRSCATAGIPEWYCACHRFVKLSESSKEAVTAGRTLADFIVQELTEGIQKGLCRNLTLSSIKSIEKIEYSQNAVTYTSKCRLFGLIKQSDSVEDVFDEYVVQIIMQPSGGLFEGTVRNHWKLNKGWKVNGNIERVNRYGKQSACLPESLQKLQKSCLCPDYKAE